MAAQIVAKLAQRIMVLDTHIAALDEQIQETFDRHRDAKILLSMPGFGVTLGATFLANTAGNVTTFDSVDRLASVAGLWPRRPEIPTGAAATTTGPTGSTGGSCGPATWQPYPASKPALPPSFLRPETSRRQVPQAGAHRARPTPAQHDLYHSSQPHHLPRTSTFIDAQAEGESGCTDPFASSDRLRRDIGDDFPDHVHAVVGNDRAKYLT